MTVRSNIALDIYCARLAVNTSVDVEECIKEADAFIAVLKENAGFFVDIEKYNAAIHALHQIRKNTLVLQDQYIDEVLEMLGER